MRAKVSPTCCAVEHDLGAVACGGIGLGARRAVGHHHRHRDARGARRVGQCLGVVAGGDVTMATRPFLIGQARAHGWWRRAA